MKLVYQTYQKFVPLKMILSGCCLDRISNYSENNLSTHSTACYKEIIYFDVCCCLFANCLLYFLVFLAVNLSIADAMVSTLNTTLNFVYMLNSNWPFGTLFCKISQFVASLSICASVFTLMAIAIDR